MPNNTQHPSFSIEQGTLCIHSSAAHYRLRWHPVPSAEELLCGSATWRPCCPEFRLVRPPEPSPEQELLALDLSTEVLADHQKEAAFAAFRAMVPEPLAKAVEPFGSYQWPLLVLLHDRSEAAELVAHNPVLAYALANHAGFRLTRQELAAGDACRHCTDRQRDILGWLGLPATEAMVKTFRKMAPAAVCPIVLRHLRNALREDERIPGMLAHLPQINAGVLWTVVNPYLRDLVAPKLLLAIAENEDDLVYGQTPGRMASAIRLLQESQGKLPTEPLISLRQVELLQDAADEAYRTRDERARLLALEKKRRQRALAAAARTQAQRAALAAASTERRRIMEIEARPYPQPPVPGNNTIEPITSVLELKREGKAQGNCVGGYGLNVKEGQVYIYRVLKPERATLSIICGADGSWRRSQLKIQANGTPAKATCKHVDRWLARHSISI
jgi:hypothetical protein